MTISPTPQFLLHGLVNCLRWEGRDVGSRPCYHLALGFGFRHDHGLDSSIIKGTVPSQAAASSTPPASVRISWWPLKRTARRTRCGWRSEPRNPKAQRLVLDALVVVVRPREDRSTIISHTTEQLSRTVKKGKATPELGYLLRVLLDLPLIVLDARPVKIPVADLGFESRDLLIPEI